MVTFLLLVADRVRQLVPAHDDVVSEVVVEERRGRS